MYTVGSLRETSAWRAGRTGSVRLWRLRMLEAASAQQHTDYSVL